MSSRTLRCSLLVVMSLVSLQCSRSSSSTPLPMSPDTSSALKSAISARSAAFVDERDRGRHAWQEAQRFYKHVYFTAWENNGALETVPDVYGIDRRHLATAGGQ